jgi:hypothetical protein
MRWLGNIDPRPQRRIIAAAVGVCCQKEGGVGSFFLEKDEEKGDRRNATKKRWNP